MGLRTWVAGLIAPRATSDDRKPPGPGDDYWYSPFNGTTGAGVAVTPDVAIKMSAVFACVKLLAETMASLPFRMFKVLPNGGREPAPDHPIDELIRYQPNETHTAIDFWTFLIWHALINGDGYAEILPGRRGAVDKLLPLHSLLVRPRRIAVDRYNYEVRDPAAGTTRILLQHEVLRIPGLSRDGVHGIPLVEYAAEAIGLGRAADEYASRVFRNAVNVGMMITHPGKLSEEGRKNFINAFMERYSGAENAHRPILLQEGMKTEKAGQTADEAQLLEARKWQVLELARFLRIPPHMLGISDGATHSNVEEQSLNFVRYTLRPWGERVEQAVRRDLIIAPDRFIAKYNFDGLLRGNSQARAEYYTKALGSGGSDGWMTPNEVRALEGLNPKEGGDELPRRVQPETKVAPAIEDKRGVPAALAPPAPPLLADCCEALVRKEITVLRKASLRHVDDPAAWRRYADTFYGGMVWDVMHRLSVSKDVARRYCAARRQQCSTAKSPDVVLEHLEQKGAAELAAAIEPVQV